MSSVEIKKVTDKKGLKAFIQLHYDLYKGNQYDAPNLYSDELHTLSKDKNAAFEFCEAEYFLAYKDGEVVGRIAGIINHRANEAWNRNSVRFGWIDFIDDPEVSKALLDAVMQWGREKGMKEIVGPLGFTDMDPEGMLIEGFDQLGTMATIYNYDYYPRHMEQMGGWEKDNDYVEFKVFVPQEGMPEKLKKISELVMKRYNLHIRKVKRKEVLGKEQMGRKVLDVVNKTFSHLYGYSQMTERQIDEYLKMYFPMLDMNLLTLIEDWNTPDHQVIGVGISISSMTRALQKCRNGRLWPFGWWHCLRALKMRKSDIVDLMLIGVLPEYRTKGANALFFYDLIPWYQKYGFTKALTLAMMETNDGVLSAWQYFEAATVKRLRSYKASL